MGTAAGCTQAYRNGRDLAGTYYQFRARGVDRELIEPGDGQCVVVGFAVFVHDAQFVGIFEPLFTIGILHFAVKRAAVTQDIHGQGLA